MPFTNDIKPAPKAIRRYYEELGGYHAQSGPRGRYQQRLPKPAGRHLQKGRLAPRPPQLATKIRGKSVRRDGTLRDDFNLHRGHWEAKDSADRLDAETRRKKALSYGLRK